MYSPIPAKNTKGLKESAKTRLIRSLMILRLTPSSRKMVRMRGSLSVVASEAKYATWRSL